MSKILLIGNSGLKKHGEDGQTVKVRLYCKKIIDEGFDLDFIDLEDFIKKPFSILNKIKKSIKKCDRVVLISAKRGCRLLIPFINRHNRKLQKPFILPLVGTSVLHFSIDKLTDDEKNRFLLDKDYSLCKRNKKITKQLAQIDYVLPETDILVDTFKDFYGLNNVFKLNNFRDFDVLKKQASDNIEELKLVFLSRVMQMKGIFDLMDVIRDISETHKGISLDVYGMKNLSEEENNLFNSYVDNKIISYKGIVNNNLVCSTLSNYDLFVFPTRFVGEGTPGVIAESLIAGTPVLSVDFPQAHLLLNDGFDSILCKMFDKEDLKTKLLYIISNNHFLSELKKGAIETGKRYTYDYERASFLKYICGVGGEK